MTESSKRRVARVRARRVLIGISVAVATAAVGVLDNATGLRPDVTVLYLLPIGVATYEFGLWPGIVVALIAAAEEILAHPGGSQFSTAAIVADAMTHLAVFLLAAVVVDRLLEQLRGIRVLEQRRTTDQSTALAVLESLLEPPAPLVSDLSIGFKQAFAYELGGDYVHVSETDRGTFIAIGDISGKGVSAALFTIVLHDEVLGAVTISRDAAAVARAVNGALLRVTPSEMFVTFFCAFVDSGSIRYVSAGHEPPLLLLPGATEPQPLVTDSTFPLGISADFDPVVAEAPFPPGALLLAVTDGVTESRALGPDPRGRLARLFLDEREAPPQEMADAVFAAAAPEPGEAQRDDITVICVRRESRA